MISPMLFSRPELRDCKSEEEGEEASGMGISETARMV